MSQQTASGAERTRKLSTYTLSEEARTGIEELARLTKTNKSQAVEAAVMAALKRARAKGG